MRESPEYHTYEDVCRLDPILFHFAQRDPPPDGPRVSIFEELLSLEFTFSQFLALRGPPLYGPQRTVAADRREEGPVGAKNEGEESSHRGSLEPLRGGPVPPLWSVRYRQKYLENDKKFGAHILMRGALWRLHTQEAQLPCQPGSASTHSTHN